MGLFIWELIPINMNMAINQKEWTLKGMMKIMAIHNRMANGRKITGGSKLIRML